jgi:hypothetical protein
MQKKTIIILITVFITVGIIILGIYLFTKKSSINTTGVDVPWYQQFNPFGTGGGQGAQNGNNDTDNGGQGVDDENTTISKFYKITDFAIAGASFLKEIRQIEKKEGEVVAPDDTKLSIPGLVKTTEEAPSVRFVERRNGHLYKMFLDKKVNEKVSNSTIPSIYEAYINNTGLSIIYRYLNDENNITSFLGTLGASAGSFLPQNIFDISISKDGTKYFYLTKNTEGVTGTLASFDGTKKNIVFNHPFTEWFSQWNTKNIYLTTKPSYSVPGSIFILDTARQTISKIFGGVDGLTTLISPDGANVLYSVSTGNGPTLGIFNIKDHSGKDLDTYGLPEKCIWSNDNINIYCGVPNTIEGNQYPDVWYQGLVSFDDFFLKINTITGEKETLANSIDETPVDATYLFLDEREDNLFFTNKKDSTLWMMSLN